MRLKEFSNPALLEFCRFNLDFVPHSIAGLLYCDRQMSTVGERA